MTDKSINFWGIYILASVQTKLCIFRKLEDEKNNKKKLDASALAQKQPHRKLGVGGEAMTSFLGRGPHPRPISAAHRCWWLKVEEETCTFCNTPPPQTNSSPLTERWAWRWLRWRLLRGRGPTALTKASSVRRLCSLAIVVVSYFRLQGYTAKRSDWKQGNAGGGGGVQCMTGGKGFTTCPPSPVRWLWREEREGEVRFPLRSWTVNAALLKCRTFESYFLLWAGDSSPASLSSSAWTCRSWSPLRCRACRSLLQIWRIRKGRRHFNSRKKIKGEVFVTFKTLQEVYVSNVCLCCL